MEVRKALVVVAWKPTAAAKWKKVLLLRLKAARGGFWQPVTGKVETGETFAEGALREAREETGLEFERIPQYLGLEFTFPSRWGGQARERCFLLPLVGGKAPPAPHLDGKEHEEFAWLDPGEAAARVQYPGNRQAIERAAAGSFPLLLGRQGAFFQDGEEVTHERTAALLHRSLERKSDGSFSVRIGEEELDVVVEDTPRFVRAYDRATGRIRLSDGSEELLRPGSLRIRADHSFACVLENGWEAAFLSAAYYQITKDVREGSVPGEHLLHFLGRDHLLPVPR